MEEKVYLTVKDLQRILHFSKTKVYELIKQDDFPSIKIGGSYLIPQEEFNTFMKRLLYKEYALGK